MLHQHWLILTARFHIHWPTHPLLNKYFVPWHTLDSEALHNKFSPWSPDQICCEALCGWALVAGAPPLFCSSWNILRRTPVSLREEGGRREGDGKRESQEKTSRGLIFGLKGESWFQNHYKLGWWVSWGGYKRYSEGERGMAIAPRFLISALYRWRCAEPPVYQELWNAAVLGQNISRGEQQHSCCGANSTTPPSAVLSEACMKVFIIAPLRASINRCRSSGCCYAVTSHH